MKRSFTISIKEPCTQNWDEMSPDNTGRFCASCQKTVIDFTKFSEEELISYFQQQKNIVCGRLTEKQLSIPIPQRPKRLTFWAVNKFAAASLIAALGLPFKADAQVSITPTHNTPEREVDNPVPEKLTLIKGVVKDENGEEIPGATITVKSTDKGTVSDIDGRFQLELPERDSAYKLICNALGMITQEVSVIESGSINIIMENDNNIKGQTITAGGISAQYFKPTLWQRLTKPFRRK
jgi:hypothetical protein